MKYHNPQPKQKIVKLKGRDYSLLKRKIYARDNGRCVDCDIWLPLTICGVFDPFNCANLSHIKPKSLGGGDTEENTVIRCFECHRKYDGDLKWSKKGGNEII